MSSQRPSSPSSEEPLPHENAQRLLALHALSSPHPSSSSSWEPPSTKDLQRQLPQYEISGLLGRGGMGAVYEGRQAKLNRRVAIKVLPTAAGSCTGTSSRRTSCSTARAG